jgi:hypothetical protein
MGFDFRVNQRAKPGDEDYWERSHVEDFPMRLSCVLRDLCNPWPAQLPFEDHEWLYGFYLPKLRIAFPHLIPHDRKTFGGWPWPERAQHQW